jgi:integrase
MTWLGGFGTDRRDEHAEAAERHDPEGHAYYVRSIVGGKQRWFALGSDYEVVCQRLREFRLSELPLTSKDTVAEAAKRWLAQYIATTRAPQGQRLAAVRVAKYLAPLLGTEQLVRVTGAEIRAYRLHLEGQGITRTTEWHVLSDVRCLCRWAEDEGLVERSPFPRRVMPRLQERPPDRLTDEEVEKLLAIPEPLPRWTARRVTNSA